MSVRIYLTGRLAIGVDGELVIDENQFRGSQGRLIFAYLVSERTRPVAREELARIVWPDQMASAWEVALSSLMSRLRTLLSTDGLAGRAVSVSRGSGQYQMLLPADAWIDVEASASAVDAAEGALRAREPHQVLGPATVAAHIARRPFLSGIENEWADSQRRKLERQLIRALDCLSRMWLHSGDQGLAIETSLEAVGKDPFREASYQLLMRAYMEGGNRAEAVKVYHQLTTLLARELGTAPSPETEALYLASLG